MAENIRINVLSDATQLKETNKVLVESGKISKEAEQRFGELKKATTKADESFKSLRQQIKESKDEATRLAQQFGENSTQARNAAQRVANLTEELSDFNGRVAALNPEAKFNALNQVIGGSIGAFQGLTGALQLFGGESEEVQKIAQRLQGFLNLTQGLNSVLGLKDAFANLRVVLGTTVVAQESLNTATVAGAAATNTASVATKGFSASLLASPLAPFIIVLGLLAAAYAVANKNTGENTEEIKKNTEALKAQEEERKNLIDTLESETKARSQLIEELNIKLQETTGLITKKQAELLQLAIEERKALDKFNSKGFLTTLDQVQVDQIKEVFKIRRKIIEAEAEKDENKIPLKVKVDRQDIDYIKSLPEDISDELEPIKVEVKPFSNEGLFKKLDDEAKQRAENTILLAQGSFDFIAGLSRNATEARLQDLEEQKNQGILSEEEYQKKLKELRRKSAQDEKALAIFQASINIASAIIKALATEGNPALVPITAAIGAAQLAVIASRPIPKFKKGTLSLQGGNGGEDDILLYANRGEAIIPTDRSIAYNKALSAIFHKTVSAKELNDFVVNKTSGGNHITASVNPYDLARGLKKSKREIEYQARKTGQIIAQELRNSTNLRHVI